MSEVSLWRREDLREMVLAEAPAPIVDVVAVRTHALKAEEDVNPILFCSS